MPTEHDLEMSEIYTHTPSVYAKRINLRDSTVHSGLGVQ